MLVLDGNCKTKRAYVRDLRPAKLAGEVVSQVTQRLYSIGFHSHILYIHLYSEKLKKLGYFLCDLAIAITNHSVPKVKDHIVGISPPEGC